jgi:hypothetical protein
VSLSLSLFLFSGQCVPKARRIIRPNRTRIAEMYTGTVETRPTFSLSDAYHPRRMYPVQRANSCTRCTWAVRLKWEGQDPSKTWADCTFCKWNLVVLLNNTNHPASSCTNVPAELGNILYCCSSRRCHQIKLFLFDQVEKSFSQVFKRYFLL